MVNADFAKQVTAPVLSLCAIAGISLGFPVAGAAQLQLRPGAVTAPSGNLGRSPESYKLGGGDRIQV
ncbi:polysaccharide export protein, partial [Microcoleus sp. herbarium13]